MLSEVLLILGGHPSSLLGAYAPDGTQSSEAADLAALTSEPELLAALAAAVRVRDTVPLRAGERAQLQHLAELGWNARLIRRFAQAQLDRARAQLLRRAASRSSRSEERVTAHMAPLCAAILQALDSYQERVLAVERAILERDPSFVASHSFVSLLSIRAELADWHPRLLALRRLVRALLEGPQASQALLAPVNDPNAAKLSTGLGGWTGGLLIDLLAQSADTGIAGVAELMAPLREAVEHSWTNILVDWVCQGTASGGPVSMGSHLVSSGRDALVEQGDADWVLRPYALPRSIPPNVADTILYLGRALHRVKFFALDRGRAEAGPVPQTLLTVYSARLRRTDVRPSRPLMFAQTLLELQQEVGEWLWRTVLTNEAVVSALDDLGQFFLLRDGGFVCSLLSELERTRKEKAIYARSASSAALHEADLELALHRAVGEMERSSVDRLHWRPLPSEAREAEAFAHHAGAPGWQLSYTAEFPLDLFLSPSDLGRYATFSSYLFALCHTHRRVVFCWTSLSNSQRVRRKFTGIGEGGVNSKEVKHRTDLLRLTWCLARDLIWFLDTILGHFQTDVIEVQYDALLTQLYQAHEQRQDKRDKRMSNASSPTASPSRATSSLPGRNGRYLSSPTKSKLSIPFPSRPGVRPLHNPMEDGSRVRAQSTPTVDRPPGSLGPNTSPRRVRPSLGTRSVAPSGLGRDQPRRLDFADVRTLHTTFLSYIQDGLLLSFPQFSQLVMAVVGNCDRFAGLIERWGGDVLPELLSEGSVGDDRASAAESSLLKERYQTMLALVLDVREQLRDLFELVVEGPGVREPLPSQQGTGRAEQLKSEMGATARQHLTQLAARLDMNGFFTGGNLRHWEEAQRARSAAIAARAKAKAKAEAEAEAGTAARA